LGVEERDLDLDANDTDTTNAVEDLLERGLVPVGKGKVPFDGVACGDSDSGEVTISEATTKETFRRIGGTL
jgi:hypothetical protein